MVGGMAITKDMNVFAYVDGNEIAIWKRIDNFIM